MSPKLVAVIKREYLQQIRTKAFWISTFLIPTIGLGFVFLQVVLTKSMTPKGKIAVVDLSGRLFDPLLAEQKSVIGTESAAPHDNEAKAVSGAGAPDDKSDKSEAKKPAPAASKGMSRRRILEKIACSADTALGAMNTAVYHVLTPAGRFVHDA